jgi:hypothetical protein
MLDTGPTSRACNSPLQCRKLLCGVPLVVEKSFFEDERGRPVTINTERYVEMMRRKQRVDMNTVIYQQDGATPHCSNVSLEFLQRYFPGDRLISRRMDNPWPAHSPADYFLWGHLKESTATIRKQ